MTLTLNYQDDLAELEKPIRHYETEGYSDITYQAVYRGMTRTRRVLMLGSGLYVAHTTIQTTDEFIIEVDNPHQGMELHFNLSGMAHSYFGRERVEFQGAQHNQLFFNGFRQGIQYAANTLHTCVEIDCWPLPELRQRLVYRPEQLEEHIARVEAGQLFTLGQARPLTPQHQRIIHDLLNCTLTGPYRRLYCEAKVWELYALQVEQFSQTPARTTKLSAQDVDKLHQVRDLLIQFMDNPLSLLELTRQTGLNLDKLKRGFKEVFGTTVFGYLHQVRMRQAQELLVSGQHTVAEVAHLVGYKNPQHFTAAFKKEVGFLPRKLKQ